MADYSGTHIETHHAWQILDGWIRQNKAIGVIFWGQSANVYTIGVVQSASNGSIQLMGDGARASFNLK